MRLTASVSGAFACPHRLHQPQDIGRRVFAVEQSVGNAVIPADRKRDKPRVHLLPAFERQEQPIGFDGAVEDRQVVEGRGVRDADLRMILHKIIAQAVVDGLALHGSSMDRAGQAIADFVAANKQI